MSMESNPYYNPFYKLLHKETEFNWTEEHQTIFEKMKQTITKQLKITMPLMTLVNHFTSLPMLPTLESEQHYCNNTQQKIK